jgi:geranylgeranyl diphosphate synthase type I
LLKSAPSLPPPAATVAAAPSGLGTSAGFARLIEGFRDRLDREITGFLAAKRAAASGLPDPDGRASGAPADDLSDLIGGVGRLMTQGGKRLRPALVYYTYRACGGRSEPQVLPVALAVEFLHTYLLIHDDIMDHADVRRGQPAAHARFRDLHRAGGLRGDADDFGRSVAILLGDLAHTYAVELFTSIAVRPGAPPPPAAGAPPAAVAAAPTAASAASALPSRPASPPPLWIELNRCFSAMCEEVIAGQYLEYLLAHRRHSNRPDGGSSDSGSPEGAPRERREAREPAAESPVLAPRESELLRVLRLKSGRYTAERPIQLGALLAGASCELRTELSRYGTAVGEAFQLQDDLLGIFGDPATVGKPVGDDLREGKFTFLIHHALVNGNAADRQRVSDALGNPNLGSAAVAQVQEVLERTGARRAVTAMIAERLDEARQALARLAVLTSAPAPPPKAPLAPLAVDAAAARPEHPASPPDSDVAEGLRFLSGLLDYLWEREQ